MNWMKKVKYIEEKLENAGYFQAPIEIINAQMVLGTPGEMYLEVMNLLLNWKKENKPEYKMVANETEELLAYGKSIGYFVP